MTSQTSQTSQTDSATRDHTDVINPATGEVIGQVPDGNEDDVTRAFAVARRAQRDWAATSFRHRKKIMLRFHNMVLDRRDELMDVIQAENGKNRVSALEEILDVALTSRYYAYNGHKAIKTKRRRGLVPVITSTREHHPPKGVVGIIAPFNYPLALAISDAIPALLAGNAVVLKPDSQTPLSAFKGLELLREAGLPEDVFQIVTGGGPEVGGPIVQQCDFLMFTGSTKTGTMLAQQAAERLIDYSMELGGKNAMIIAPDAPMDRTIQGAWAACFGNSGQLCISIERIYVHQRVADEFIPRFVEQVKSMKVGAGPEWDLDMGVQISEAHTDKIEEYVNDAVEKGATVLAGGKRLGPAMFEPTVLADVPDTARLKTEEVFGPVVFIETVRTLEEAVNKANALDYGLNSSVWAAPVTGRRIAKMLESGTVNINEGYGPAWSAMDAPMGGWKKSGVGRRHGEHGITKYTEPRNVSQTRGMNLIANGFDRERYAAAMATALKVGRDILR